MPISAECVEGRMAAPSQPLLPVSGDDLQGSPSRMVVAHPRSMADRSPPAATQGGCARNTECEITIESERNLGGPCRFTFDEVLGAVDRIDDPASRWVSRLAALLAHEAVQW